MTIQSENRAAKELDLISHRDVAAAFGVNPRIIKVWAFSYYWLRSVPRPTGSGFYVPRADAVALAKLKGERPELFAHGGWDRVNKGERNVLTVRQLLEEGRLNCATRIRYQPSTSTIEGRAGAAEVEAAAAEAPDEAAEVGAHAGVDAQGSGGLDAGADGGGPGAEAAAAQGDYPGLA